MTNIEGNKKLNLRTIGLLIFSFIGLILFGRFIVSQLGFLAVVNFNWNPIMLDAFISALPYIAWSTLGIGILIFSVIGYRSHFQVNNSLVKKQSKKILVLATILALGISTNCLITAPLVSAGATATTGYYLATPYSPYDWLISKYSTGSVYAINGSNWANLMTFPSTTWASYAGNSSKVQELVLGELTYGTVYLKEVAFDYGLTIPDNVQVIENVNGLTRVFVNSDEATGSPYTISVDTVNLTYYLCQDSMGRFIDSWTSTNKTFTIDSALKSCGTGGTVYVNSGDYSSTTVEVPDGVRLELSKGAIGITYSAAASATCAIVDWQIGNIDYYYSGVKTAYINFTGNDASFSPAVVWDADWNATVEDVVDAYSAMAWKSGWNATVENIVETLFSTQGWSSNWDDDVNSLIAAASISWAQITNANATVQQIVDAYSTMAWKSGWNATVSEIASSGVAELTSLIISGTGTFGNVTLSSGHFPTDIDYTIYQSGGTIYAKYSDGTIDFSGTNASAVIQSTVNALENTYTLSTETSLAQDTGTVFVKAGNYTLDSPITIDKRTHLVGSDSGQTWFVASANLSPSMLIINASNLRYQDWGVQNIAIDMVSYTGNGIYSTNAGSSGSRCTGIIENVIIYNVQSGYSGVELTNPFHLRITSLRVSSSGTGVKFLQSGNVHYGNSLFQDWMLWCTGDNTVGLNVTSGGSYRACNLAQFDRIQVQGSSSNSGTVGVYWDGNSLSDYVTFNNLNIERMETGVMFVDARYFTFIEPFIWTDEDNADNYGMRLTGSCREIKVFGGLIGCGANSGAMAYSDESTSTSYKHLLQNVFLETYWGDFESNTRLENVNAYRLGAGTTRQNQHSGTATNTSATQIQFDHGCFNNPNILECSFNTTAVSGWSWTTTISTVTLTYTGSGLPASVQVSFSARYDPTFNDPS